MCIYIIPILKLVIFKNRKKKKKITKLPSNNAYHNFITTHAYYIYA